MLETVPSARAFLQEHGPRFDALPGRSNYFSANARPRRLDLARAVNRALRAAAPLPDRRAHRPERAQSEGFARAGHWHPAAPHAPRHDGTKRAGGHFYSLDRRGHPLRHLAVGEGWHEHDMSGLKRLNPCGRRPAVPKGRRGLLIHDTAGIDFACWKRCRHEGAV